MARVTLHRAGRIQELISSHIGRITLEARAKISIFSRDAEAEVERRARDLLDGITRLQRLEAIRASLRGSIARQNAETGISGLLAEKASLERQIAMLAKLVDQETPDPDVWAVTRRRRQQPAPSSRRGRVALAEQIAATRARFEAGEGDGETEIVAPLLDDALEREVRQIVLGRRRRLDDISDHLRTVNSSATVELDDDAAAYLRQEGVI
ncbi:MAG: hypothetical protein L0210_14660 [Rhodospirillales bacterium]|nr:hypothetical protein [Rhodospirillales bacterium]